MSVEEKVAQDMMDTWIAKEIMGCGYPVNSPEDFNGLYYAVKQAEISVVTRDETKIEILIRAIDSLVSKFSRCRDEVIQTALTFALALQIAAQNTLAEIRNELHLEIN